MMEWIHLRFESLKLQTSQSNEKEIVLLNKDLFACVF